MRQVPIGPVKKPYQPPTLIKYGDLSDMTRTRFAGKGMMDMAAGARKT